MLIIAFIYNYFSISVVYIRIFQKYRFVLANIHNVFKYILWRYRENISFLNNSLVVPVKKYHVSSFIIIISLLQSTAGRRPPPCWGVLPIVTTLGRRVGDRSICTDCVVFTRGAAAHLSDKPLVASYDTHGQSWGDAILFRRHHTAMLI